MLTKQQKKKIKITLLLTEKL